MLSGIKKGKRKRKVPTNNNDDSSKVSTQKPINASTTASSSTSSSSIGDNREAAAELRRLLGIGQCYSAPSSSAAAVTTVQGNTGEKVWERLERKGKIKSSGDEKVSSADVIILRGDTAIGSQCERPLLQKEDLRHGSRKGKKTKTSNDFCDVDANKTVEQMVAEERRMQGEGQSMDEMYARNIARLGSRYKGTDFGQNSHHGASAGADEEDCGGDGGVDMKLFSSQSNRLTDAEAYLREKSRQLANYDREQALTKRCWWWMKSCSFRKHMLLSLGDFVSLVLTPSHLSLVKSQCFLVPVKHAESFVSCEDEVWEEVKRFQTSLRSMFKKEGKGVLFCETVLPSKGFWQSRIEVIPVPQIIEEDSAIFFKSALTEQAEEWGTHTKLLSTKDKGLRRTLPKGFPYFSIEWDGGGFAQIIENASFPKDFATDTIAGMMELDPVRFNRRQRSADDDRGAVLDFVERWKAFDWTLDLDDESVTPE